MKLSKSILLLTLICISQSVVKAAVKSDEEDYEIFGSESTTTSAPPAHKLASKVPVTARRTIATVTPPHKVDLTEQRFLPEEPFIEHKVSEYVKLVEQF
jgi:hypothetical protein